jgi:hypothetical protein
MANYANEFSKDYIILNLKICHWTPTMKMAAKDEVTTLFSGWVETNLFRLVLVVSTTSYF